MKKIKIQPLYDYVVIKPSPEEEVTKSGIVLPDTADKEKPQQGEIIVVGPGRLMAGKMVKPQVKVGDKVLYKKFGPDEIKIDNEDYLIGRESEDILGVIK